MMLGKDCTPSARGDRSDSRKILKVSQRWGVERMARLDGRLRKEGVLHMRDMLSRRGRGGWGWLVVIHVRAWLTLRESTNRRYSQSSQGTNL